MAKAKQNFHSDMLNFAEGSYLERTSRPVYAIIFLLPLLIFYELGTILINTDIMSRSQVRVVAFVWLQEFMAWLGFSSKVAWLTAPVAVILILTAFQIAGRKDWRIDLRDMFPMWLECLILAVPLLVLSLVINSIAVPDQQVSLAEIVRCATLSGPNLFADIITGIGAGIYEELVFRLILIGFLMIVLQDLLRIDHRNSVIIAVAASAALFSLHHHIIFIDGQFNQSSQFCWPAFSFRTVAGVYFAALYAMRGFAATAGTHAIYNVLATMLNFWFFTS